MGGRTSGTGSSNRSAGGSINKGKGLSNGKKFTVSAGGANGAKPAASGRTGASNATRNAGKAKINITAPKGGKAGAKPAASGRTGWK